MATPTIVFAPQALDILRQAASRHATLMHDDAVGGLLIGKRDGDRIVVLAASEPGPNADDRRLGVALDVGYINALLEAWFEHDPTVDLVGMWHTHPQDLLELTLDDVAAAYTLREDGGNEIVSAIALAGDDPVRCFYLDAVSTGTVGLVSVPYRVEGDAPVLTPVMPIVVAPSAPVVVAPAVETAAEVASPPTAPDTTRTTDDAWTTDETDLALNPPRTDTHDPVLAARPRPSALMVFGVIAVLLLFGLWRFFTLERPMVPTASAPTVTVASVGAAVVATVEPSPALPATATLVPPTATTGATATPPATPTQAATLAPTEAAPVLASATVETTAPVEATTAAETTTAADATPGAETTTVASSLAYGLAWRVMTAAERTAFEARARALDCADCYNVDLIGPAPYADLRVRIDGRTGTGALRTFDRPALVYVPPRDAAHTLQVYNAQGKAVSPPLTVQSDEGAFYVLRITRP